MACELNLKIDQGSTFEKSFRWRDTDGDPKDLTGYSIAAQIRSEPGGSLQANFGAAITDPTNGEFKLVLAATASSAIQSGWYVYDIELTQNASTTRVVEGKLEIRPEVTK